MGVKVSQIGLDQSDIGYHQPVVASIGESQAAQSRQPCVNCHWLSQWESLGTSHFWPPTKL